MNTTNKKILVVDDERPVADTMVAMLDRAGYSSIGVYSAADALAILQTTEPALIIADVVMPRMNGIEFAIEAAKVRPATKILLISGNVATQEMLETARIKGHNFQLMAKPIPPRQLLAIVADLLTGAICCLCAHGVFIAAARL
jgi:DNA-binding NtrC family response regulator